MLLACAGAAARGYRDLWRPGVLRQVCGPRDPQDGEAPAQGTAHLQKCHHLRRPCYQVKTFFLIAATCSTPKTGVYQQLREHGPFQTRAVCCCHTLM